MQGKNPTQILLVAGKMGTIPFPQPRAQSNAESRNAGSCEPYVIGCPVFPQGHSVRRTGDGHERSLVQEPRGATLPATPAARAAPAGPLHPPPPQHLLLLPRARAALLQPGRHPAIPGQPQRPHLGSHFGKRGACWDLPMPSLAPPGSPRSAPPRSCLLLALPQPLFPARPGAALPGQSRSDGWRWCFASGFVPVPVPVFVCTSSSTAGLGDSEYMFFCNGGRTVDRRLQELGAQHFYDTGLADDCVGLELVVDPWIDGLWLALKKALQLQKEKEGMNNAVKAVSSSLSTAPHAVHELKLSPEVQNLKLEDEGVRGSGVLSQKLDDINLVAPARDTKPSLVHSVPPVSQSALNIPALPPEYIEVEFQDTQGENPHLSSLISEGTTFEVPVTKAVQLTREDAIKTALLLELDIADTAFEYQPGDAFCVICPNNVCEVEELLHVLGLTEKGDDFVCVKVKQGTKKKGASRPQHIPGRSTLKFILTWCLEIRAIPKKAFLRALVECTSDAGEKRRLQELCSRQGASDYNSFIRDSNVCLLDLLHAFPSCKPSLSLLIEYLPKLQARSYSVSSSNLYQPGRLCFVFNVVEFPAGPSRPVSRKGVCTGWLAELVAPLLHPSKNSLHTGESSSTEKIYIFPRPKNAFHLPADPSVPFIMVGPGTGISPFIGFLQHRQKLREQHTDWVFGETWLFFGCRHQDRDYLFKDELQCFLENGTLTHLKVCFSRDSSTAEVTPPKYVQDVLRLCAKEVARVLLKERGYFYICGNCQKE
uniref:Methionine synthase reductase n=1 Tax=Cyanistes caeruleus TaxID=156563 RepID=A0A8C0ZDX8_CYACU